MGIQIVAQRPGDAFLLAAVAVRRIENLEEFNEIILDLKRRPHGGWKALFLCVFAERNQVHPLQILFQLLLHSDVTIQSVGEMVGLRIPSYFIRVFKQEIGITPAQYRMFYAKENGGSEAP